MRDAAEYVSTRALGVDASGIRKVFDLAAKLPDPINLSIGLPDFDVPEAVKRRGRGRHRGRAATGTRRPRASPRCGTGCTATCRPSSAGTSARF